MKVNDFLKHINKNQRSKLVDFLKSCDSRNTKLELVSGQLANTAQNDAGTLSFAICYQHIHSNGDRTWDFIVATDTMATKDKEEAFTYIRMDAEFVRCMLPAKEAKINFESEDNEKAGQIGTLTAKVEILQEKYNDTKEAYELVSSYLDSSNKEVSELSAWKSAHSGNYRNAGRPRKFDKFEQGRSIYVMHDKEHLSFRRIAELMDMSFSSARRLYQEYIDYQAQYGKKPDVSQRDT